MKYGIGPPLQPLRPVSLMHEGLLSSGSAGFERASAAKARDDYRDYGVVLLP
jgi:hypothetical protein